MASGQDSATFDLAIAGGGLTGLTAALSLAGLCEQRGWTLAIIAPELPVHDQRTTALLMPSVELLDGLGVWQQCMPRSAPLRTMRLIDATARLFRAPLTDFRAAELDLEAFGYNVPNTVLLSALDNALAERDCVTRIDATVHTGSTTNDAVHLSLSNGQSIIASMAVAADGRNSKLRDIGAITTRSWSYPQTALALNFGHSLPHQHVSTEFHTESGPFTQVPLPPRAAQPFRSSLVWVVKPQRAQDILDMDHAAIAHLMMDMTQRCFGEVTIETTPQAFPLSGLTAHVHAANRVLLAGEAAHVFPPIGAQGFNLGLRDVAALSTCLTDAADLGTAAVDICTAYHRHRAADVMVRTGMVDLLNRSLPRSKWLSC